MQLGQLVAPLGLYVLLAGHFLLLWKNYLFLGVPLAWYKVSDGQGVRRVEVGEVGLLVQSYEGVHGYVGAVEAH